MKAGLLTWTLALLTLGVVGLPIRACDGSEIRPNILWISCEDISSHLRCYGDTSATTPHLDQLAEQGILFTHAFSCHGVCAPSRTGIITGMHPISLGANHMRSRVRLPEHIQPFPALLRQAGYYCTNNSKTDYNFHWTSKDVWDESSRQAHWKNRPRPDQPFFAVFNLTMTHESQLWPENWQKVVRDIPEAQRHQPAAMPVPPLYPDTPEVRGALARLRDVIQVMDAEAGRLLQELHDAGLDRNTIVVFWSDHGDGFARAKRWVHDSGTRVPLIVRVPEALRTTEMPAAGTRSDRLVTLLDLAPTVLSLAGVAVPSTMQGQSFLQPERSLRQYVHMARDRIDERFDLVRSVRDRRYRYIRTLMPWRPALQHVGYSERSVVRQEMRRLLTAGTLDPRVARLFQVPRAHEELYDLEKDAWELNDLATDPAHRDTLQRLRDECDRWQLDMRDAHLIPESILDAEEEIVGSRWGVLHGSGADDAQGLARCRLLLGVAAQVAGRQIRHVSDVQPLLQNADPAVRWWAVTGLSQLSASAELTNLLRMAAQDSVPAVRIAAARGLRMLGDAATANEILRNAMQHDNELVRHAAVLEADESGPAAIQAVVESIRSLPSGEYSGRIAEHALGQIGQTP